MTTWEVRDGQTGEGREEELWKRRDGVEREREREKYRQIGRF